jgi:hypothetical protein
MTLTYVYFEMIFKKVVDTKLFINLWCRAFNHVQEMTFLIRLSGFFKNRL